MRRFQRGARNEPKHGPPHLCRSANRAFLTRQGAQALANVQRRLAPQGLGLKIFDAYRPARATRDMGTPYETFSPAAHTANATGAAAQNRAILVDAMHAEGFVNYEGEWWHFNYFVSGAVILDEPVR